MLTPLQRNRECYPPQGVLDFNHSLTKQLSNVIVPASGSEVGVKDAITRQQYAPVNGARTLRGVSRYGPGWYALSSVSLELRGPVDGFCRNQSQISVCCVAQTQTGQCCFWQEAPGDSASGSRLLITSTVGPNSAWQVNCNPATAAASQAFQLAGTTNFTTGVGSVMVWTFDSVNHVFNLFVNGSLQAQLVSSAKSAFPDTAPNTSNAQFIGGNGVGPPQTGAMAAFYVWKGRVLTQADARMLAADPFCFFI